MDPQSIYTITFSRLPDITGGSLIRQGADLPVTDLLTDSRKLRISPGAVFVAITGDLHDGHRFIHECYRSGIRQFIVEHQPDGLLELKDSNVLLVHSAKDALQSIAMYHRSRFSIPVLGITGSNGKTIVKEWLGQMLSARFTIARSPGSYNSQIGVPLSVWQLDQHHELGIFEAGISKPGEMERLERIIKPRHGIFTTLGPAHDQGFADRKEKLSEKLKLFRHSEVIFFCEDHQEVAAAIRHTYPDRQLQSWSMHHEAADLFVRVMERSHRSASLRLTYHSHSFALDLPFADEASVENALHCVLYLLHLQYSHAEIQQLVNTLQGVHMRLEMKQGIHDTYIIDDSYNNDLAGLHKALEFMQQQPYPLRRTVILSDILESGVDKPALYRKVGQILGGSGVSRLIVVGPDTLAHRYAFDLEHQLQVEAYPGTEALLKSLDGLHFHQELILVKGARAFSFERIVQRLQQKIHGTVLEIDLDALTSNLNFYRSHLRQGTKLMVMVKAFAYGSSLKEIAHLLQFHRVDYLAVAYADEGVFLREHGIHLPIMVMNPSPDSFDKLLSANLEPEIYSMKMLEQLGRYLSNAARSIKVHLKIDTGMRRLGFEPDEIPPLLTLLEKYDQIQVAGAMSHLAGADEDRHEDFSHRQAGQFIKACERFLEAGLNPLRHLVNSAGILRYPEYHMDMVRLGIGLYGIESNREQQDRIQPISTFKTTISQVKHIRQGETIGYGRSETASHDMDIATIAVGYADGYDRGFSNGVGEVIIRGRRAPVTGRVCMDMTMVDVTGLGAEEGDEVLIFGPGMPVTELARKIDTISYEILTNISERVKRVFTKE
ncbi:bifunctional UDP-N-acetylmuramoyl-tripeptide:D-alanyl-D-alanine ligase/alanine racemase [Roseivirga sp. BDSF3-8]|uniref:bifunctional UDP-N-acetylmuramoyl-tripeptide:D-alanyl-D-alanine ligase/alanine racemase n=1 Tax=Roseivirga sp. BDSF3-8 TaxID=3241598 RepID=UPI003531D5AB